MEMEPLYYSRARLAGAAAVFLLLGLFFVWLWSDPSVAAASRRWRWLLASDFGRYFFIPGCAGTFVALAGLGATLAFGDGKALEASATHLSVSTLWGRKRIALCDLKSFGIERSGRYPQLVLEGPAIGILGGSTLRVALGAVHGGEAGIPTLLENLARLRAEALKPRIAPLPVAAAQTALPRPRTSFGRKGS
jgi:hypothetical protein